MPNLIFHLGLTKTASSFVQKKILGGKLHTLHNKINWEEDKKRAKLFGSYFRNNAPTVWKNKEIGDYLTFDERRNVVISHESLYEGFLFEQKDVDFAFIAEPFLLAKRLGYINRYSWKHGKVKAFLFFRKQSDWLPSFYSQVCFRMENPSQQDFENKVSKIIDYPNQYGYQCLCYDLVLQELKRELGPENVIGFPYEAIQLRKTWDKISNFTNIANISKGVDLSKKSVNVKNINESDSWRLSKRVYTPRYGKVIARLLPDNIRNKLRSYYHSSKKEMTIHMPSDLENQIYKIYKKSNERLNNMISYDLDGLGYI